jgi:hypothetical protein
MLSIFHSKSHVVEDCVYGSNFSVFEFTVFQIVKGVFEAIARILRRLRSAFCELDRP